MEWCCQQFEHHRALCFSSFWTAQFELVFACWQPSSCCFSFLTSFEVWTICCWGLAWAWWSYSAWGFQSLSWVGSGRHNLHFWSFYYLESSRIHSPEFDAYCSQDLLPVPCWISLFGRRECIGQLIYCRFWRRLLLKITFRCQAWLLRWTKLHHWCSWYLWSRWELIVQVPSPWCCRTSRPGSSKQSCSWRVSWRDQLWPRCQSRFLPGVFPPAYYFLSIYLICLLAACLWIPVLASWFRPWATYS